MKTSSQHLSQRGFSSVMILAMIVLLAMLTTYTLHFVGAAQGAQAVDIATQRVQQAAMAGLDWQRYQLRNSAQPSGCQPSNTLTVPFTSGSIVVTVNCALVAHTDGGIPVHSYSFSATACWPAVGASCPVAYANQPGLYVERQLTARAACSASGCTW